jgi:hypothetical protein
MIALAGAVPASAAPATAAPSIRLAADPARVSTVTYEVSAAGCTTWYTGDYMSIYGYWTVKAWFSGGTCGWIIEAAITCYSNTQAENIYGREDSTSGTGSTSFAACNSTWPNAVHGGYRAYYSGAWHYQTYLYDF